MSVTSPPTGPHPGLDLERLEHWLEENAAGLVSGSLDARLVAGGKSNLTYEIRDDSGSWILRRPPMGHVLATAHDMAREYQVMTALAPTDVPVPTTYAFCDDLAVLGSPFYLMEMVSGTPYRLASELETLGADRTRLISTRLVDTLADLHQVDPADVGLRGFGQPEGFLARQVRRWRKQLDASYCRNLALADVLHGQLTANVPLGSVAGIVHGDFRLDNVLVDECDRPAAVIDWEMATLGDPLSDLALTVVYHRLASISRGQAVADSSSAPGFLSEPEVLDRYALRTHQSLEGFGFYVGLAAFKLAAILEGIHYRHLHGQTVGPGFDHIGDSVEPLLEFGLTSMKEKL
jgi:aminoglycoside phosphotransferase (APT) family kinase protein